MKHTKKYNQGYRYYVYICPGHIEYFVAREAAAACAYENHVEVQEVW